MLEDGEYSLYLNLTTDDSTKEEMYKALSGAYPFISDCVSVTPDGGFSFQDSYLDSCLSSLMDASNNMTDQRSFTSPRNTNVLNSNFQLSQDEQLNNSYNQEVSDLSTSDPNKDPYRGNVKAVKAGMRVLEIYDISDGSLDTFVSDQYLPLGNSALNVDDRDRWWYVFDKDEPLRYSINYHICRANFIYLNDSKGCNNLGQDQKYLVSLPRKSDFDLLIPRDVRAITYLNVNTSTRPSYFVDGIAKLPSRNFIFSEDHTTTNNPPEEQDYAFVSPEPDRK
jgi:hypothetical protein